MKQKNYLLIMLIFVALVIIGSFPLTSCETSNDAEHRSINLHEVDTLTREEVVTEYCDIIFNSIKNHAGDYNVSIHDLEILMSSLMLLETSSNINGTYVPLKSSTSFDSYVNYAEGCDEWFDHLSETTISKTIQSNNFMQKEIQIKRYQDVFDAKSYIEFAYGLQKDGYATDDKFAIKVIKIYDSIKNYQCFN